MIFPIKHFPVNWVDGMKISKDHFIDSDKHFHDAIRNAASVTLTNNNFGLLPQTVSKRMSFELHVRETGANNLELTLTSCNAITPGGFIISIEKETSAPDPVIKELKGSAEQTGSNNEVSWFDLVLVADPYKRIPSGNPSLEENPPRHPYSEVNYYMDVLPTDQVNSNDLGAYHLVIGKIKNKGGHLTVRDNFIPPCASIQSHPSLVEFHSFCAQTVQSIQRTSFNIIRKIHEKNRPSNLAKNFMTVCVETVNFISKIQYRLINQIPLLPPIELVGCFSEMANLHYTNFQCMHPEEKEELMKYFFGWCDVTPNEIENSIQQTMSIRYNHFDIVESLTSIKIYLRTLEVIWNKLNTLEFIGQTKENIVVTKQTIQPQTAEPVKKNRWSILD